MSNQLNEGNVEATQRTTTGRLSLRERCLRLQPAFVEKICENAGVSRDRAAEPARMRSDVWGFARVSTIEDFVAAAAAGQGAEDEHALRATAVEAVPVGSVVWGKVIVTRPQYILLQVHRIICVPDPGRMPARWSFTAEENLVGIVHHTENDVAADDVPRVFVVGTTISAVVLTANPRDQPGRMTLSVVPSRLPRSGDRFPRRSGLVALGLQPPGLEAPAPPSADEFAQRKSGVRPWEQQLLESRAYFSPACVAAMAAAYNIAPGSSVLRPLRGSRSRKSIENWADDLKGEIKRVWAAEAVRRGVAHAKGRNLESALKCYNQALELDARQIDAYVARGAALANDKRFKDAISDFETALEIDPGHVNARKYLAAIREKMGIEGSAPPKGSGRAGTGLTGSAAAAAARAAAVAAAAVSSLASGSGSADPLAGGSAAGRRWALEEPAGKPPPSASQGDRRHSFPSVGRPPPSFAGGAQSQQQAPPQRQPMPRGYASSAAGPSAAADPADDIDSLILDAMRAVEKKKRKREAKEKEREAKKERKRLKKQKSKKSKHKSKSKSKRRKSEAPSSGSSSGSSGSDASDSGGGGAGGGGVADDPSQQLPPQQQLA